ncbi:MAG TPA: EamA family transporter [Bryobacteraceae bacterium]|jgi:transporter family protein|nr:EamA family transporter [Bryobacteraceae bacterium]
MSANEPAARASFWTYFAAPWMSLSLLTVLLWGAWGLESKIVVDRISPWMNQVLFAFGLIPPILWMLFSKNLRRRSGSGKRGAFYALLTGTLGATGNIALYLALARGGKASVVVPLVGLAPLVTVVLAVLLLRESMNRLQVFGLVLALVSIYLLSL